jgi:hypothetical protein
MQIVGNLNSLCARIRKGNRGFSAFDPNSDFMMGGLNQNDTLTLTLVGVYAGENVKYIYYIP